MMVKMSKKKSVVVVIKKNVVVTRVTLYAVYISMYLSYLIYLFIYLHPKNPDHTSSAPRLSGLPLLSAEADVWDKKFFTKFLEYFVNNSIDEVGVE